MRHMVIAGIVVISAMATGSAPLAQQPGGQARGSAARGASAPAPVAPKAVGSVRDIMRAMTVPSSDAVFSAGADAPTTAAAWEQLRLNAVELAESGNLLMIGARVRDRGDWMRMARAQVDAAEVVVRLAASRQSATLSEASDKAYDTCTTCHNKYWTDRNKAE